MGSGEQWAVVSGQSAVSSGEDVADRDELIRWSVTPPHTARQSCRGQRTQPGRPQALVLLDIDGTLLDARGAGRRAFQRALRRVSGWNDDIAYISFAGATDLDVLRQVFDRHGARVTPVVARRFFRQLALELEATTAEEPPRLHSGVRELLAELAADPDVMAGLVTGNTGPCAHIKLRAAGIHGRFLLGAFGHEHADRLEIARLALRRAQRHARGRPVRPVVLIGDTPADIAAARAIDAVAVAVATGTCDLATLRAAGADHVVPDLTDQSRLRALWLGRLPPEPAQRG